MKWTDLRNALVLSGCVLSLQAASMVGTAGAQPPGDVEFVGCLPGWLNDTQLQGSHAFCATPSGMLVLDVTDIKQPTQVTFLPLPNCFALTIAGQYAYIAAGNTYGFVTPGGLHIVDISEPGAPVLVGSFDEPMRATDVIVDGSIAYVADSWNGLFILDVSDPTAPIPIGFVKSPGPLRGLDLVDDIVYLADQYYGIRIIDVSNPGAPKEITLYDPWGYILGVDVQGDFAYIASDPGVHVVDVSNPSAPVEVGVCDTDHSVYYITVDDDRAYLSHYDSMSILDITKPTSPVVVGGTGIYGRTGPVVAIDSHAFVSGGFGGLRVIDIANAASPAEVGSYGFLGNVSSVEIQGDIVVLTGGFYYSGEGPSVLLVGGSPPTPFWAYSGLFVIDLGEPWLPAIIGYCPYGNAVDAEVAGRYAYVSDSGGRFGVLDLVDPAAPVVIGTEYLPYRAGRLSVSSGYGYVVTEEHGLRIVDVGDPASPEEVASIALGSNDVEVQGDLAYTTDWNWGLQIIDVSDPTAPIAVGSIDIPNWSNGLAVSGDFAYVANGILGLRIIDVSDPASPIEISVHDTPGTARNVAVEDSYAYVADDAEGVRIVDVGDPSLPVEIGYYTTPRPVTSIAVAGELILAGTGDGGLIVLRTRDLTAVEEESSLPAARAVTLVQNVPNPFNPHTVIGFELPAAVSARLSVYDLTGSRVATLVEQRLAAGVHRVTWDGKDAGGHRLPSGVYFYRLEAGDQVETKRMTLLR